jgi:hypothetical protein
MKNKSAVEQVVFDWIVFDMECHGYLIDGQVVYQEVKVVSSMILEIIYTSILN